MPPGDTGSEPSVAALARTAMAQGLAALAAAEPDTALRWLERAHRLLPSDPNAILSLASACLAGDPSRAEAMFGGLAGKYDVRQAWLGLAAARLRMAGPAAAVEPLAIALSRHVFTAQTASLADQIGLAEGFAGWCGLTSDRKLEIRAVGTGRIQISLDGKRLRGGGLPVGWPRARQIDVTADGQALLGSPIRIDIIRRVSGCVEVFAGGIRGWAWHPGDPDRLVELTLSDRSGRLRRIVIADDETIAVPDTGPLARARSFHLTQADLSDALAPIHVRGPDGKDLLGSPLDPFADQAVHIAAALRLGQTYPAGPARRAASRAAGA